MRFASDISIWWLIPWAGICVFLTIWFYKNVTWINGLTKSLKLTFKSLRWLTLFLLGVLWIGILFEAVSYREEKPIIITLVDESSSMRNYKDSSSISSTIDNLNSALYNQLGEDFELVQMTVGSSTEYKSKPVFRDPISNLSEGFEKIHSDFYNRNVGAIVFVSDGNFNKGNNPVYAAEKINFTPVYALSVGDTIPKRDHYIKNVSVNDVTFYKNKFPVEVDIEAIKMGKSDATVSISSEGKTLASQKVHYKDGKRDFERLSFLLDATKIGFQTYTVTISKEAKEYNYKNNTRVFYLEVIDSRSKVLMLAGAPHPDISSMKQVIEEDQNLEVESVLTKDWNRDLKKIDFIIWHEPGINFDAGLNTLIQESKIPVLYCVGPNTNSAVISRLNIGMSAIGGSQTDDIQGTINESFLQFELSDELKQAANYFPPLKTKFGELKVNAGAEILMFQRLGNIKKKEPLIFFNKRNTVKFGVIYGEGIWKWKINEFVRTKSATGFTDLISKIAHYLLVKQNTTALHVTFPKRFSKDEEIEVNASFYNESMQAITLPKISLSVKDETGKLTNFQFGVIGDMYKLSLGKMRPGKYSWTASASFNGKSYRKSGVFVVEDIAIEQIDTYANQAVMNQLASKTKGEFELLKNYQKTIDAIKKRNDITSISIKTASFNDLIDYKIIALLLFLTLTIEWFLRRWYGGY